jgi:hypothetical protein
MKSLPCIPVFVLFIFTAFSRCFALQENEEISKERAKALGVSLRSNPNGEAGVKVWIEFKATGELKNFSHVDLQIGDGEKRMVTAPLMASHQDAEGVSVQFSADPAWLPSSVLTIVVSGGPRSRVGYQFKVKDFIELPAKTAAATETRRYETVAQVKAMPPCKVTVESKDSYSATLKTADGKTILFGGERAEQWLWHFVCALKKGETCELPGAFSAWFEQKVYTTAASLAAMPACKATRKVEGPCFSVFATTDGKWFTIGDPGADEDVEKFLGTLTDGKEYAFPAAFLDYKKKPAK